MNEKNEAAAAAQQSTAIQQLPKDISAQVLTKVEAFERSGELKIPSDYSPENALKSAYIILSDPENNLLEKCSKSSIANALLKMVVWGLSPLKGQCYFIPYKDQLKCTPDYSGNIALAKRYGGLKSIKANAIFQGDDFEFAVCPDGHREIIKHKQTLQSINTPVVGAYAVTELQDGTKDTEIMSIEMIRKAWEQGGAKGVSPAHQKFTDQMACKTVINRACKLLIRSSDDSVLFGAGEDDDQDKKEEPNDIITEQANKGEFVDFDEVKKPQEEEAKEEPATQENAEAPFM